MHKLRLALFAGGWLAVVGSGFLAPRTFLGLLALGLDAVAFGFFLASVGAAARAGAPAWRRAAGWVAAVLGAGAVPLVAHFWLGVSFHGPGAQPADIRRFPTLGEAFGYALGDPTLLAVAAAAPLALAVGWWAVGRPAREAAGCYLLCLAAYPAIVLLLHLI